MKIKLLDENGNVVGYEYHDFNESGMVQLFHENLDGYKKQICNGFFIPHSKIEIISDKIAIPIGKEPAEMYETTHVYENCVFCNKPTDTWHDATNNPVCADCSTKHAVSELTNWMLKRITINGEIFIIQSYLKDDFVNLSSIGNFPSIRIDFVNNTFTTCGKENKVWIAFVKSINIEEVKSKLTKIFRNEKRKIESCGCSATK